jgi:hypothetical protein
MRELAQAIRGLLRFPAATVINIVALALGITVNVTTLISINALLLHPFPYPDSDRLVFVSSHVDRSEAREALSPGELADLQNSRGIFESLAAYRSTGFIVRTSGIMEHLRRAEVTPSFLRVFGMNPMRGGSSLDDRRSAVISYSFWKSHLGSSKAVGSAIRIDGKDRTVVGIMPDSFDSPLNTQVWIPVEWNRGELQDRAVRSLGLIGRLKHGVSAESQRAACGDCPARRRTISAVRPRSRPDRDTA